MTSFAVRVALVIMIMSCGVMAAECSMGNLSASEAYAMCLESALCRNVYEQEHGEYSPERFVKLAGPALENLRGVTLEKLAVDYLVLQRTLYAESRCPPNHYFRWEAEGRGTCTCYIDRDCALGALPICYDAMHPILLFCILAIILLFSIVYCCTGAAPKPRTTVSAKRHGEVP